MSDNILRSEKLHFNVSTYLKDIIGRDLITNEIIAIFELVKNSFDARATSVSITINPYENLLVISDNGHGMSMDDIKNKWLFLAYSEKINSPDKAYAGSKGIGRFSADRLGEKLVLRSKRDDVISEIIINWSDFQKNQSENFSSISIDYNELQFDEYLNGVQSGTVLYISNLREEWNYKKVLSVERSLAALINPISTSSISTTVYISYFGLDGEINRTVSNPIKEVLIEKTSSIDVLIQNEIIKIELKDSGKSIYNAVLKNSSKLTNVHFILYYMNTKAKHNFSLIMKENLKNYGNIFIYKNNFRVMPYGEPEYDTFKLNMRKTQGYNRFLGLRELLGWVSITDTNNHFKEASSRDAGFVNNDYTISLSEFFMDLVLRPLEDYVQLTSFGTLEISSLLAEDSESSFDKLINRFRKYEILSFDKYELPTVALNIKKQVEMLTDDSTSNDDKEKIGKNIKDAINRFASVNSSIRSEKEKLEADYERLKRENDLKTKIILKEKPDRQTFLEHELGKASSDIRTICGNLLKEVDDIHRSKILPYIAKYFRVADKLLVIEQLVLRVSINTKAKKHLINIHSYLNSYFTDIIPHDTITPVIISDNNVEVIQGIDIFDFGILIDNLYMNAIDLKATKFDVYVKPEELIFITDTPAITIKPIEKIFELGITTKSRGFGMGLYIVKQIAESFNWQVSVENLSQNLVAFTFKFKRNL